MFAFKLTLCSLFLKKINGFLIIKDNYNNSNNNNNT